MGKKLNLSDIEAALLTQGDLAYLKAHGPRALPNSPTANKWNAESIKRALYEQPEILFAWLSRLANALSGFATGVDDYLDMIAGAETVTGSKTFSSSPTFSAGATFSGNTAFGASGSDNSKTLDIYFTCNLRGPVASSTILPGNSGFTLGDASHRWNSAYLSGANISGAITHGNYTLYLPEKDGTLVTDDDLSYQGNKADNVYAEHVYAEISSSFVLTITTKNRKGNTIYTETADLSEYIDSIPTANSTNLVTSGGVYAAISTAVSSVYRFKGSVSTYDDLPSSDLTIGDVYNVATADPEHGINAGDNVAWTGSAWDVLAGDIDLSNYYTISQVDSAIVTATTDMTTKTWVAANYYTQSQAKANFAPLKGDAPYLTVGAADNFTPYGPETTSNQTAPFIIEGTATNNNTGKVDTGGVAYIKAKRGNSVVVNQKAKAINADNWNSYSGANTMVTFSGGTATVEVISTSSSYAWFYGVTSNVPASIAGHKYLIYVNASSDDFECVYTDDYGGHEQIRLGGHYFVWNNTSITENRLIIQPELNDHVLAVGDSFSVSEVKIIDLTQWFGSNDLIPSDLLTHPEHLSRYYNGSLEYNEGELVSAQGQALLSRGRNVWDEKWELGALNVSTGADVTSNDCIRNRTAIRVIPGSKYYFKSPSNLRVLCYDADENYIDYFDWMKDDDVELPPNCFYIKFYLVDAYGPTYNNDITISLYYPNEGGYDQYYPYVTGNVGAILTGSETLRSCGSVYDEKKPSGKITRVLGEVDLSDLTWTYNSSGSGYWTAEYTDGYAYSGAETPIALSEKYVPGNYNDNILGGTAGYVFYNNEKIYVNNGSSSIEPTGKLIFKLAEPEEENGTSFPANLPIEDFGYLYWSYAAGAKQIPQGIELDYPAAYRGFVDSLLREVGGDTTKIVNAAMSQSDFDDVMESYGYHKESDITSDIETTANLYVTNKKVYKTGHVVTISISAANISGSEIAANTTLFTLPNYLYSASYDMRFPSEAATIVVSNDGKLSLTGAIANNARVDIYITYAI